MNKTRKGLTMAVARELDMESLCRWLSEHGAISPISCYWMVATAISNRDSPINVLTSVRKHRPEMFRRAKSYARQITNPHEFIVRRPKPESPHANRPHDKRQNPGGGEK